ncbi:hypothetical protein M440DRAFT_252222 [Trichoderma longibrachiatum ATCC 18648]|uniref:Uncharacterized protein n=1 Tax=Trichoderma longibrachiatum ATCC 18648 TaxID=983965 RepID=A0A2T4C916_TRILO|nr:hypothetical protein M440DRAFT_252222 [Trichoderma longibrachiatum ATCC 18648]
MYQGLQDGTTAPSSPGWPSWPRQGRWDVCCQKSECRMMTVVWFLWRERRTEIDDWLPRARAALLLSGGFGSTQQVVILLKKCSVHLSVVSAQKGETGWAQSPRIESSSIAPVLFSTSWARSRWSR